MSPTLAAEPVARHAARAQASTPVRLGDDDRPALLAHFLRLEPADRRLRFMQASTDAALADYVAGLDLAAAVCFGSFDSAGELVALTEGFVCERTRCVEAAFSTDARWRRRGLARLGFAALESWCAALAIERIVLHCDARNAAMRGVLRSLGAHSTVDDGEVDAVVRPTHALH